MRYDAYDAPRTEIFLFFASISISVSVVVLASHPTLLVFGP